MGTTRLFCTQLYLLFKFRWRVICSTLKNEFSCIIIYTLASFEPLSTVFFSPIFSTTFSIRYFPSRYNSKIPVTYKTQNSKQKLLWILHPYILLPIFIFISKTSRITVFSTYNFHCLNFHSLSNPTKHGILHTTLLAGSCQGHQWFPCHETQ